MRNWILAPALALLLAAPGLVIGGAVVLLLAVFVIPTLGMLDPNPPPVGEFRPLTPGSPSPASTDQGTETWRGPMLSYLLTMAAVGFVMTAIAGQLSIRFVGRLIRDARLRLVAVVASAITLVAIGLLMSTVFELRRFQEFCISPDELVPPTLDEVAWFRAVATAALMGVGAGLPFGFLLGTRTPKRPPAATSSAAMPATGTRTLLAIGFGVAGFLLSYPLAMLYTVVGEFLPNLVELAYPPIVDRNFIAVISFLNAIVAGGIQGYASGQVSRRAGSKVDAVVVGRTLVAGILALVACDLALEARRAGLESIIGNPDGYWGLLSARSAGLSGPLSRLGEIAGMIGGVLLVLPVRRANVREELQR